MAKKNLSHNENVHCTAKTMMAMFIVSIITILTACTDENVNYHPSSVKNLMVEVDSTMTLGATDVTLDATATTAESKAIDGSALLSYVGLPKVYVKTLGMPTTVTTTDGKTFTSSDDNHFDRSFTFTSTTGVKGESFGTWSRTVIIEQLNDSTELVEAQFDEEWTIWTNELPEEVESSRNGTTTVRVQYLRVVKPSVVIPDEITWRMRPELDAVVDGEAYYRVYADKLVNGEVSKSWNAYVTGISFGTWKPNVAAQTVTSTAFTVKDHSEDLATDETLTKVGTDKCFDVVNHSKVQYHFDVRFPNGSDERTVKGAIVVWSNTVVFHNPETGEDMSFVFDGKAETTVNEVTTDNVYTRTVEISCNGDVVDTQVGNVQLTVQ